LPGRPTAARALAGGVLLAAHAALFALLLARCERHDLALAVPADAPAAIVPGGAFADDARLPAGLGGRVVRTVDGAPAPGAITRLSPGVHRLEWQARWRGGHTRRIGRTVLAGPLQDPAAPPCGVRLVVGQALLDALEPVLVARVRAGLRGQLGFRDVAAVDLHVDGGDSARRPGLALHLELAFSRGRVPVDVRVVPALVDDRLVLTADVQAEVELSSTWLAGAIELVGQTERLDGLVTQVAESEVDKVLGPVAAVLSHPPPIDAGQGRRVELRYCRGVPIEVVHGRSLAVPLAVPMAPRADGILPVDLPDRAPLPPPDAPLAVDLSLDAANAILHQMWDAGRLDLALADAGLERRFNDSEAVRDLLTVRAGRPRLALPPTLEPSGDAARPVRLSVEAEILLTDGDRTTPARLFGQARLDLRTSREPGAMPRARAQIAITALALTCLPRPGQLEACYATLFDAAAARSAELSEPIARAMEQWFDSLLTDREVGGAPGAPSLRLTRAVLTPWIDKDSGWFRVEIEGRIADQ
jgi:hypothetical protein